MIIIWKESNQRVSDNLNYWFSYLFEDMLIIFQFWSVKQMSNCLKIKNVFTDGDSDSRMNLHMQYQIE